MDRVVSNIKKLLMQIWEVFVGRTIPDEEQVGRLLR